MTERSAAQWARDVFHASVEYYHTGLTRCAPADERRWKRKLAAARRVIKALENYERVVEAERAERLARRLRVAHKLGVTPS